MYSDPNYHSLNHWNILQTLTRKGVQVPDPPDCALTETVLIQTNPLKMVSGCGLVIHTFPYTGGSESVVPLEW